MRHFHFCRNKAKNLIANLFFNPHFISNNYPKGPQKLLESYMTSSVPTPKSQPRAASSGSRCSPAQPTARNPARPKEKEYLLLMRPKPPAGRPTQPSHFFSSSLDSAAAPSALVGGTYSACLRRAAGPSHPAPPDSPLRRRPSSRGKWAVATCQIPIRGREGVRASC